MTTHTGDNPGSSRADPNVVRRLLQHVPLAVTQTALITRGPQVLAHRGALSADEAGEVAIYVAEGWGETGQTLRIQFMPVPLSSAARLLLTYPLHDGYQITLVDVEAAPLEPLRRLGGQLMTVLAAAGIAH